MPLSRRAIELLREAPDDVERHLVVADQLQAKGDPRGELIALEAARLPLAAGSPRFKALSREIDRHLKVHAKQLLGGLWTASSTSSFEWKLGFIRKAALWTTAVALGAPLGRRLPKPRVNKLLKQTGELMELESAVLLEHLTLAATFNSQLFLYDAAERVAQGAPSSLHVLELRDLYERAVPDWEPMFQREIVWRRQVLTLRSDSLSLESAAELFGA
jgi:uncharacterized protein (TIGR02996 family)